MNEETAMVRRILKTAFWSTLVLGIGMWIADGWRAAFGLTCGGVVVMINFLWLEEIVQRVLQPAPRVKAWRLVVRTLARFALFGVALAISIFVARFNPLSVLLGFSVVVIGIGGEALYQTWREAKRAPNDQANP